MHNFHSLKFSIHWRSITIPLSVTLIGSKAFKNCNSLAHITIPSSVTHIGDYAFHYGSSYMQISIPFSVKSIGKYAFSRCIQLEQITFEDNFCLYLIDEFAFEFCESFVQVNL